MCRIIRAFLIEEQKIVKKVRGRSRVVPAQLSHRRQRLSRASGAAFSQLSDRGPAAFVETFVVVSQPQQDAQLA
jgi:hypothetical protein